jgi:Putative  PD-(D/E)XK family member, (DUF4420)
MTDLGELRVCWTALASDSPPDGRRIATVPLEERVAGEPVLLGRDLDGGRHMLIPTPDGAVSEDRSSDAVQIRELELGLEDKVRYTDVVCGEPGLVDVFDDLILAMLRVIGSGEPDASRAAAEILERWRSLLRPPSLEPLNVNRMAGLVAELHTAIEILGRDPGRRVDVWLGSTGARHDFRRGDLALEVKATLGQGEGVEIHGLDQLAEPSGGTLHLFLMRLERVPEGQLSVAGLLERLRGLIGGSPALYERLTEAGWSPDTSAEQLTFDLRDRRVYAVKDGFPRLTQSMLATGEVPTGVRNVRYEANLEGVPAVPEEEVEAILDALATGGEQ